MKLFSSLFLSSFLLASAASAQTDHENTGVPASKARGTKVGIGIAIEPSAGLVNLGVNENTISSFPVGLRVPLNFSSVKLEPELAVLSLSRTQKLGQQESSEGGTILRFGSGIYYNTPVSSDASVYVGPKIGLIQNSREDVNSFSEVQQATETSRTDIFIAVMLGGEYFFSSRFSIGAEVGLEYQSHGEEEVTETPADPFPSPTQNVEESGAFFTTKAALTGRFYF